MIIDTYTHMSFFDSSVHHLLMEVPVAATGSASKRISIARHIACAPIDLLATGGCSMVLLALAVSDSYSGGVCLG